MPNPGVVNVGSSPHARGARDLLKSYQDQVRIIPACAGSTYCDWFG
mgnify:CR=1 FL=1